MRFTIYEYYRATDSVFIDIPDEEIKEIAEECKAEGRDKEYFIERVKDFIGDTKWDYEVNRDQYDSDYDDWEYSDDFDSCIDELEEEYEDYFNNSAKNVGEFGND